VRRFALGFLGGAGSVFSTASVGTVLLAPDVRTAATLLGALGFAPALLLLRALFRRRAPASFGELPGGFWLGIPAGLALFLAAPG